MRDFESNNEQQLIKNTIREFGREAIWPIVRKIDNDGKIPADILKSLAELNLLGMTISPDYGGIEADPVTVGIVVEELAKADISCAIPTFFLVQAAWGYILEKFGNDSVKEKILPLVTQGKAFLGIAATEPDIGSDLGNMKTTAKKSGENYQLTGEKMFISGIREIMEQMPAGGGYVMLAKTEPDRGTRGISMFYIPIKNTPGIATTLLDDWGRRGISTGGFSMEDVCIPQEYLLGTENRGFYQAMEGFDFARAIISIVCCGAAMSALEHAMEYLKMRRAFGQPIGRFEGIQLKLAEHWAKLDALRLLGYKALWLYSMEQKEKKVSRFEVTKHCAEAKLLAPPFAFEAINDAIQWFGAFGYTVECPLDLALKGVRSYYWAEGTLEIMKIIVARELLGKDFVAYR